MVEAMRTCLKLPEVKQMLQKLTRGQVLRPPLALVPMSCCSDVVDSPTDELTDERRSPDEFGEGSASFEAFVC